MNASEPRDRADRIEGWTASTLRRAFDESFARPPPSITQTLEGMLAIRVGTDPYLVRLSEISGLYADLKITAVPSSVSQLMGIVGLRGTLAPVYDLAALMQYSPANRPRWMILAGGAPPVAFAFETFEAHLQVPAPSISKDDDTSASSGANRGYTRGTVHVAGGLRPIIHMASVMERIRNNQS